MSGFDVMKIGHHKIGPGQPCYIIAEIGINHNGVRDLGRRLIEAAASTGVDAVKFQNYRTEDFLSNGEQNYRYFSAGVEREESQFDLFKRCELTFDDLAAYRKITEHFGLDFISTPTSKNGVDDLIAVGAAAVKNGSDFLGNLPLLRHMATSGLPTIVSTGMAIADEIKEALSCFPEQKPILLHCVSIYPAPISELNLLKIPALAAATGCLTGFSDHSVGVLGSTLARALGACVIEKHFTLDRGLAGPDHAMSSDPAEMKELVRAIRATEAALGAASLVPSGGEGTSRKQYRLSCVAARYLPAGHTIVEGDVVFHRPAGGIKPADVDGLMGRQLARAIGPGHVFEGTDFR